MKEIVKQQNKGFCITEDQISEAVKKDDEEQAWNDLFAKQELCGNRKYQVTVEYGDMQRLEFHEGTEVK